MPVQYSIGAPGILFYTERTVSDLADDTHGAMAGQWPLSRKCSTRTKASLLQPPRFRNSYIPMARLILLAALLWLGWLLYRRWKRQGKPHGRNLDTGEHMVRCAYCHVHLPPQEALEDPHANEVTRHLSGDRHWFCCKDHQARFISQGPKPRRR